MGEERFQPVATSSDAMSGMDSVGTPSKPSRSARAGAGRTFLTPSRGYSCCSRRGPRLLRAPRLPRPPCRHLRKLPGSRKKSQRVRLWGRTWLPRSSRISSRLRSRARSILWMGRDVEEGVSGHEQLSKRRRVCCGGLGGCVAQRLGIGGGWREEARSRLCRPLLLDESTGNLGGAGFLQGGKTACGRHKKQRRESQQKLMLVSEKDRGV